MVEPSVPARRPRLRVLLLAAALVLGGCSAILEGSPEPTPQDFPGIAGQLADRGIAIQAVVSGDAGCDDPTLIPTAIGFDASGAGVAGPVRLRVYIFRNGETFDRRRVDVDACVAAWATDPATVEFFDARPFVIAGQGPLPEAFTTAVREALTAAAGNGG